MVWGRSRQPLICCTIWIKMRPDNAASAVADRLPRHDWTQQDWLNPAVDKYQQTLSNARHGLNPPLRFSKRK
jgi:hypothetical protein